MSFDDRRLSNRHRRTADRPRVLAVAADEAAIASEPCPALPDDGGMAIYTPPVGKGGRQAGTAMITITAATQVFSDVNTATNRPPGGRASRPPGRPRTRRIRSNGGPTSNEPTSVSPTRPDGAVFVDENTPMKEWHHSRGEKPWT